MSDLKKVSMNLSHKSVANIQDLSILFDEKNKTRVVSTALGIALSVFEQVKKGKHIILRDNDGSEQELFFIPR